MTELVNFVVDGNGAEFCTFLLFVNFRGCVVQINCWDIIFRLTLISAYLAKFRGYRSRPRELHVEKKEIYTSSKAEWPAQTALTLINPQKFCIAVELLLCKLHCFINNLSLLSYWRLTNERVDTAVHEIQIQREYGFATSFDITTQ